MKAAGMEDNLVLVPESGGAMLATKSVRTMPPEPVKGEGGCGVVGKHVCRCGAGATSKPVPQNVPTDVFLTEMS